MECGVLVEWIGSENTKVLCPNLFICGVAAGVKLYYCSGELRSPYFINCNAIFVNGTSGKPSPTEVFAGHYNNVIIGCV